MQMVESIRIGSSDYKVEFVEGHLVLDNQTCYGVIEYDNNIIKINKSIQSEENQKKTFLHEVFHGVFKEQNIEVDNEEELVEKLAISLYSLIRDNPELFK